MMATTYPGSGDTSKHRTKYRPERLDELADDVTIEGSVLTGIAEGPEAIRAILGLPRRCTRTKSSISPARAATTASSRTTPDGARRADRQRRGVTLNEAGQTAQIVVSYRPLLDDALVPAHGRALRGHAVREALPRPRRPQGPTRWRTR